VLSKRGGVRVLPSHRLCPPSPSMPRSPPRDKLATCKLPTETNIPIVVV
jgi:hypothetical protein